MANIKYAVKQGGYSDSKLIANQLSTKVLQDKAGSSYKPHLRKNQIDMIF